jgi:aspartyl-tRNA(Asn)/glutamyl-tRNA(Gln) amidotransferase subunit C
MTHVVIDKEAVRKIASLARLRIEDSECEKYANDLTAVLGWFEMLDEVDVSQVLPANSRKQQATQQRKDEILDGGQVEAVITNATDAKFNMFSVPKVVE